LKSGAEINAQNDDLDTPMHLALRSHRIEIVYMLLRHGADARLVGLNNNDCVQIARDIGWQDLAKTLKNFNASMSSAMQSHAFSSPQLIRNH
jgi:ankyrin repeat protein